MNDIHEMVGAYVLDALGEDDAKIFEAHLAECSACRAEVAELSRVVGILPLAIDEVEPPTTLKDRILQEVVHGESDGPGLTLVQGNAPARPRSRQLAPWQGFAAAAAAVVLAAVGGWNIARHNGNTAPNGGAVAFLQGSNVPTGIQAAVIQPPHGSAYFVVDGMKPAPAGKVYELWLVHAHQKPQGVGVFRATNSGPQVVRLPVSGMGWPKAAVTIEPGPRGSAQPTTPPIMSGKLVA